MQDQGKEKAIGIRRIKGYNHKLETERQAYFRKFLTANDLEAQKEAMRGMASLTALRCATFISAYERAIGLCDE